MRKGGMPGILDPKSNIRVGTWNVRTMFEVSKTAQVVKEMGRYKLDLLGLSEVRWTGHGKIKLSDGDTIVYSGHETLHHRGVAIVIPRRHEKTLIEWEPIIDRIIKARFESKFCKLTIIQVYAPTNETEDEAKDIFYETLQATMDKTPRHDMMIIIGDLNAKVGQDNIGKEVVNGEAWVWKS